MRVRSTSQPLAETDCEALVVPVLAGETPGIAPAAELLARGEARTRPSHLAVTHLDGRPLILVGLGPRSDLDAETVRRAAAAAAHRARELGARSLAIELPEAMPDGEAARSIAGAEIADALVTGVVLAAYRFDRFRADGDADGSGPDGDAECGRVASLVLAGPAVDVAGIPERVQRAATLAAAQNRARDLGNTPPNVMTPTALSEYAAELAARHDALTCEVTGEAAIRTSGMGAFAAVAAGSAQEAQLIVLRYEGPGAAPDAPRLALIGKAVTFDSGGLNLKPGASMIGMKFDMCGGAAVIETVAALAELGAPVRVLAVVGATENMTGGAAMRPGDVLTALDGTTIEMNNADAEGRLVLADCIVHAKREGCAALVDVATLTGGVVTALGTAYAGVMSNDDAFVGRLIDGGGRTGERLWRLPLDPAYAAMIRGRVARIMNLSEPPRQASAITAAEFLHHFAGTTPWAHLDIAGVADGVRRPYFDKGATGFGVRLLAELALDWADAPPAAG